MLISIVVPVFNEEKSVPLFYSEITDHASRNPYDIELVFVDDGSSDDTPYQLDQLANSDPSVTAISLSRNFGKEAALLAGLTHASGDAVVPMDVDLQDPIGLLPKLVAEWQAGADVVLAKRSKRRPDSALKRWSAITFYKLINKISETPIEENVGDFRLMSRRAVDAVLQMPERTLFMKGLLSWVGFDTAIVEYERPARSAGESKFNGWKLWNLALEGITSFSTAPLKIWTYIGFGISSLAFLYAVWLVVDKLVWGNSVPGYPSMMTAILFFGGVQLIGIGVLGEYIGRIYMESKQRPRYIIKSKLQKERQPKAKA